MYVPQVTVITQLHIAKSQLFNGYDNFEDTVCSCTFIVISCDLSSVNYCEDRTNYCELFNVNYCENRTNYCEL